MRRSLDTTRQSLGALSDVTEEGEPHQSSRPPPPPASVMSPPRADRQSVASQFSDVSELQDFLADDYVEKFKARSPPPAPRLRRAPSLDQPSTPTQDGEVVVRPRKSVGTQNKVRARTEGSKRLVNDYEMLGELGRGAAGRVELCVKDGKARAIKVLRRGSLDDVRREVRVSRVDDATQETIFKSPEAPKRAPDDVQLLETLSDTIRTQVAITKHLKHRNLVTLYEVIDDPSHHTLYLVLEYCERGPLLKAGKDTPYEPISEDNNRRATRDVLRGLEYLHSVNVVHRDLKPENIVLDGNGTAKLCDFGVSRVVSSVVPVRRSSRIRLTPAWAAPELFGDKDVTAAVDCWSLGATIHAASTGSPPVVLEKTAAQTLVKVESGELNVQATGLLGDLLHGLLERDVCKRIDVSTAMGHAWVTDSGNQPLPRTTYVGFSLTQHDVDRAINTLESSDDEATTTDLDSAFADVLKVQSESDDDEELVKTTGGVPCAAWRLAHLQQPGPTDEDRVDAVTLSDSRALLLAYDGHGGSQVVDALRHTLPAFLSSALTFGTPTSALESAFSYADNIVVGTQPGTVGACAAVVIVDNDAITCANVGDVAVVLIQSSGAPTVFSTKHCKANDEERKRVEQSGAHWANGGRVNGVLRVSRSFGDGDFKGRQAVKAWKTAFSSDPVIAMPSISVRKRSPSDALIIVMTDGVVDGFGSECKAASYIRRQVRKLGDLDKAAKATLDEARARGSKDDLSLLVCDLRDGLVAEEVSPKWAPARPPPAPSPREAPEAYDDDFAFDEGVAESKADAPPPAPAAPNLEGGTFGVSLKRAERAAARAWSASQPPPAPERFAL